MDNPYRICAFIHLSLKSRLQLFLIFIAFSALRTSAHSAEYSVSYSGGKVYVVGPFGGSWNRNYTSDGAGGWGGSEVSRDPAMPPLTMPAGPGSVWCKDEITTTLTWPTGSGEPRPKCIIVRETCTAGWLGDYGSSDNGLGFTEGAITDGGVTTGVKYSIISNPGNTETIHCSPEAFAFVANPPASGQNAAFASVSYKVEVAPLYIELSGGKDNGAQYLIGQQLQAQVKSPFIGPLTRNSCSWSTDAGDPFKEFYVNDAYPLTSTGERRDLTTSDWHSLTLTCCFAKPEDPITVSCDVTLSVPSGAKPTSGLSASLSTVTKSIPPTVGTWGAVPGSVQASNSSIYLDNATPMTSPKRGIIFQANVLTPDGFGVGNPRGSCQFVQLLTSSNRTRRISGVTTRWYFGDATMGWFTDGIDGAYPYAGTFPASGSPFETQDAPSQDYDGGGDLYTVEDHFEMYLMYQPPGSGSQWVPLRKMDWYWQGTSTLTSGNYVLSGAGHNYSTSNTIPDHPAWTRCRTPFGSWR